MSIPFLHPFSLGFSASSAYAFSSLSNTKARAPSHQAALVATHRPHCFVIHIHPLNHIATVNILT